MKRKYYLRGLGFGILVTAIVCSIAGPKAPSDEDIIKRAEELGQRGGYTRIYKLGERRGDAAPVAIIELI